MEQSVNINLLAAIYFLAGAAGTFGRVWLSPAMELGLNKRAVVEVISGGVAGFTIPYLFLPMLAKLVGLDPQAVSSAPTVVKAGLVFLLSGSGSLLIGELMAKFGGGSGEKAGK